MIQASSTPSPRDWGPEDGAALRQLREAAGLTLPDLARRAALSVAQVRELETGGRRLFYSPAIQLAAGRRLLGLLGSDRPWSGGDGPEESAGDLPARSAVEPLPGSAPQTAGLSSDPLADPVPMAVLPRGRSRLSPWAQGAMGLAVAFLAFQALDRAVALDDLPLAGRPSTPTPATGAAGVATTVPVTVQAPSEPVLRGPGPPVTFTAAPVQTRPTQAAVVPATALASGTASVVQAPVGLARSSRDACDPADREPLQVQSTSRLKPGNYVYLVADRDAVVCVLDAQAQLTRLALEAGQGRSVYGAPPWRLLGKDLPGVQVYFQGYKVPVASLGADYVQLTEHSTQ